MLTKYDKAGAAVIGGALTSVVDQMTTLEDPIVGAIGTLLVAVLVYLVPNK